MTSNLRECGGLPSFGRKEVSNATGDNFLLIMSQRER